MAKVQKTIEEINQRIKKGEAVVVTAEEMIGIVGEHGAAEAAHQVDVVTTGTFSPMCCLLYTSPSPRDRTRSRMPSSA